MTYKAFLTVFVILTIGLTVQNCILKGRVSNLEQRLITEASLESEVK